MLNPLLYDTYRRSCRISTMLWSLVLLAIFALAMVISNMASYEDGKESTAPQIQTLKAQVDTLKASNDSLQGRVDRLQQQ